MTAAVSNEFERLTKSLEPFDEFDDVEGELGDFLAEHTAATRRRVAGRKRSESIPASLSRSDIGGMRVLTPEKRSSSDKDEREKVLSTMLERYGFTVSDIDSIVREAFMSLSLEMAKEASICFDQAGTKIYNPSNYLLGIVKRLSNAVTFDTDITVLLASKKVQKRLEQLEKEGKLYRKTIDTALVRTLNALPEATQLEILDRYNEVDIIFIKNKNAFLKGICRRYTGHSIDATKGSVETAFQSLHSSVRAILKTAFYCCKYNLLDLDTKCLQKLHKLPLHIAIQCATKLSEADLNKVSNLNGFFVGILKRHVSLAAKEQAMSSQRMPMYYNSVPRYLPNPYLGYYPYPPNVPCPPPPPPNLMEGYYPPVPMMHHDHQYSPTDQ